MTQRIPHTDCEVITGEGVARDYLKMQQKLGRFYLKHFLRIVTGMAKGGSFLEIGPGPGYQTSIIAQRFPGAKITALEYSADMVAIAKDYSKAQGTGGRVRFIHGSVEDAPLLKGLCGFDLVYSTFSLHHWPDPVKAISNLYGALNDNGTMLLYDFRRGGLMHHLPIRKGVRDSVRASYVPEEIEGMLQRLDIHDYRIATRYPYMWVVIEKRGAQK